MTFRPIRAAILFLFLIIFISGCQSERIRSPFQTETGEFYSSGKPSSAESGDSAEKLKLQADFETFCTDLFKKEMESSSTLDLHYTLLHPEDYGIDSGDATIGTYTLSELMKNNHALHDLKEKLSEFDPCALSTDQ